MQLLALAPFAAAVATAMAAAATTADAWKISATPLTATTDARVNEPLAKTWTIAGNVLEALTVQSMGRVFVDYDASLVGGNVAAKVVITGDQRALLNAIDVVDDAAATDASGSVSGVKIHFPNDAFEGHGYLLTHILVANKHALRNVTMTSSADMVVGSDVLVEHDRRATVGLSLDGSGDLYAGSPSTELSLGALGMTLTGAGTVQLVAKSVDVADVVETSLTGDGTLAIVADRVAVDTSLSSLVAGAGAMFVQSDDLVATSLSTTIAGAGSVTYARAGSCVDQHVVVVGSGNVSTASIACTNTFVNLVGTSAILVQATESLTVSSFFLGDVSYYGATPANLTAASMFDYGVTHPDATETVQQATTNSYAEYTVKATPTRTAVYVEVKPTPGQDEGSEQ